MQKLKEIHCKFSTIPSVTFEFRRTDSIAGFNKRTIFLEEIDVTIFPIEQYVNECEDLTLVLQKINGRMSYTDFLLYCCLYKFPDAYLLTKNHKDFLTTILDRTDIITIDNNSQNIRNLALYQFSQDKYEKAAENILKGI